MAVTKRDFLGAAGAAGAMALSLRFLASGASAQSRPGLFAARDIAEAGYIYGLPLVMNYGVMYEYVIDKGGPQYKGPFNTIANESRVFTYKDTAIVTPNSDTPYSMLWLDLRAEPIVISVPAVDPRRYYSVQLCDGNTFNYGYIGSRATGGEAGDFLVVGPRWSGAVPEGIKRVFQSSTDFSLSIFRTQLFSPDDMPNVLTVQEGYKARPLSAYLGQPAPPPAPEIAFPPFSTESVRKNFLGFLDFALQFAPAMPNEIWMREQLARIGVGPGKSFSFEELSLADKAEVLLGLEEGKKKVDAAVASAGTEVNGWSISAPFGTAAEFHGDWLRRAVGAQAGIYGNSAEEAMYPITRRDSGGELLDGSKRIIRSPSPRMRCRRSTPSGRSPCMMARHSCWSRTRSVAI